MISYEKNSGKNRYVIAFVILIALVLLFLAVNVCAGSVSIPFMDVLRIFGGKETDQVSADIVLQIRFPRALAAAILGGGLALSGYLLQTFFIIPLQGRLSWEFPRERSLW